MPRPTYVAFTTHGCDWWVVHHGAPGESRAAVELAAETAIAEQSDYPKGDIHLQTELRNLSVLSRSQAERRPALRRAMAAYNTPDDD